VLKDLPADKHRILSRARSQPLGGLAFNVLDGVVLRRCMHSTSIKSSFAS
jgi:hypothetical protein